MKLSVTFSQLHITINGFMRKICWKLHKLRAKQLKHTVCLINKEAELLSISDENKENFSRIS